MTDAYQYKSLTEAARAVIRIHGPLSTVDVSRRLREIRNQLPIPSLNGSVPMILDGLQERGEVEYRAGLWVAKSGKGDR